LVLIIQVATMKRKSPQRRSMRRNAILDRQSLPTSSLDPILQRPMLLPPSWRPPHTLKWWQPQNHPCVGTSVAGSTTATSQKQPSKKLLLLQCKTRNSVLVPPQLYIRAPEVWIHVELPRGPDLTHLSQPKPHIKSQHAAQRHLRLNWCHRYALRQLVRGWATTTRWA